MSKLLQDNQACATATKATPNEYINTTSDSQCIAKPRQEPGFSDSQRLLGMANCTKVSPIKREIQSLDNTSGADFPSLPVRSSQQEHFFKEKTSSTSPITILDQNGHGPAGRQTTDPHDTHVKMEHSLYVDSDNRRALNDFAISNYITPEDFPPPYMDFINSSTSQPGNEGRTNNQHKSSRQRDRFDSGLGDSESFRGSSCARMSMSPSCSSHSVSSPRLSTQFEQHYEDIDQYSKTNSSQHQASLQSERNSGGTFKGEGVSMRQIPSHVDITGGTSSDTEDNDLVINTSMAEAIRELPLHDPRVGSLPHTYMPLRTSIHKKEPLTPKRRRMCSCPFILVLLLVLVISLAALGLSIYIFTKTADFKDARSNWLVQAHSPANQSTDKYDQDIIILRNKIDDLIKENAALKDVLLRQEENLTSYIEEKVTQLSQEQLHLTNSMQLMEDKLQSEISLISLTPGPQGPPGIANFSLCVNRSVIRHAVASNTQPTETSYLPSDAEIQDYFVTFAYCNYNGATDAYLESTPTNSSNKHKYRCKCWGKVSEETWTSCKVIIWMCP